MARRKAKRMLRIAVPGGWLKIEEQGKFGTFIGKCNCDPHKPQTEKELSCERRRTMGKKNVVKELLRWLHTRERYTTRAEHMGYHPSAEHIDAQTVPDTGKFKAFLKRAEEIKVAREAAWKQQK